MLALCASVGMDSTVRISFELNAAESEEAEKIKAKMEKVLHQKIFFLRTSTLSTSLSMCEAFYLNNTVAMTRYRTVDVEDVILGVHPPYLPKKEKKRP